MMRATEVIDALRSKLTLPGGRHLYGVLGTYAALDAFAKKLLEAKTPDGQPFPKPLSVNRGILESIPDVEFGELVRNEARRPEPTFAHAAKAFETFLRAELTGRGLVVLTSLEMVFAYRVELNLLRTLATDDDRVLLFLPGRRERGQIIMYPDATEGSYVLPPNLIADNHLWELRE